MYLKNTMIVAALSVTAMGAIGCGTASTPSAAPATSVSGDGHSHDAWWCDEHGVPEEVCALCSVKLAADFKAKGDWCKEHDRPDSQCFVCHPDKEAEFAAQYEAKYGKKPPKPNAEDGEHEHHEDGTKS